MTYLRDLSKFDFSWFIPAIVKYRRLLGEVMLISFVLQLIGLITPLGFQVVMDKVLVNRAMQTLTVIGVALLCAALFDAVLSGIRTWIFAHTSSKIDVELGQGSSGICSLCRSAISRPDESAIRWRVFVSWKTFARSSPETPSLW